MIGIHDPRIDIFLIYLQPYGKVRYIAYPEVGLQTG